ncbi:MAG: DUF3800 domain-containing protein [Pirellulales bacterium]|nr:DUF3800 domain-containing protein [Pirellulales bacterium]
MLLFIDESGHDGHNMPCETLAGVAIAEDCLWNLVRAIRSAEREFFGDYLRNLHPDEIKGRTLLKRKRTQSAARTLQIERMELAGLAHACLRKGMEASRQGLTRSTATEREIVAYSRQIMNFAHHVIDLAASFNVQLFASVVDVTAPRPEPGRLRKDYVYLFERYFYFLETLPVRERGLIVFDELDKARSHVLLQQMAAYFLGTETGRYRSSRIVPEPFFVHSDLTTGVFLADLAAYILGWAWRLRDMRQPIRPELSPYADKLHGMQFVGEKPRRNEEGVWRLFGIRYIDDLRGQFDREEEEE